MGLANLQRHRARRWLLLGALSCSLGLVGCLEPMNDTHPNQVFTKRRTLFKQLNRAMEPLGLVASGRKEYQAEAVLEWAQDLEKLSTKPWVYFPADGNYPPTRALPTVWSQPEAFRRAQDDYLQTVRALVAAAQAGKPEGVQHAVDAVTRSCKACHTDFRSE